MTMESCAFTIRNRNCCSNVERDAHCDTGREMQYDAYGFPEDAERITVAQLAKIPSSYQDKKITFTCDVLSFPKDDNGNWQFIKKVDGSDRMFDYRE